MNEVVCFYTGKEICAHMLAYEKGLSGVNIRMTFMKSNSSSMRTFECYMDALFLSLVGGLGFAVPVPGGIGAFHYVISLALLGVYGIPMEVGVIYATLSHTSQAITQILFGAGSYAYEALKK